jgi:hypothetical protein
MAERGEEVTRYARLQAEATAEATCGLLPLVEAALGYVPPEARMVRELVCPLLDETPGTVDPLFDRGHGQASGIAERGDTHLDPVWAPVTENASGLRDQVAELGKNATWKGQTTVNATRGSLLEDGEALANTSRPVATTGAGAVATVNETAPGTGPAVENASDLLDEVQGGEDPSVNASALVLEAWQAGRSNATPLLGAAAQVVRASLANATPVPGVVDNATASLASTVDEARDEAWSLHADGAQTVATWDQRRRSTSPEVGTGPGR